MSKENMLSTIDNPFDPFEQFVQWFLFDIEKGYSTCERLASFTTNSDEMTELEENEDMERAIDLIIANDILGIYKKMTREIPSEILDNTNDDDDDIEGGP